MNIETKEVSVIIPVYNDSEGLKNTLISLVKQDFPKNLFEIIVADNGSTDSTLSVIESFIDRYPKLIRTVREDNIRSSYAARNKGIKKAQGSLIAFIDADMSVNKDWICSIVDYFKKNKVDYMGCKVEIILKRKTICGLYNKMIAFPIASYILENHFVPTCCLLVRKKVFDQIGLFDPNLISGGDSVFGNRVYNAGYKIFYEPNIVMKHPALHSLRQIFTKALRIGRGYKQTSFYYPDIYKMRIRNILNPRYFFSIKSVLSFARSMRGNEIWEKVTYFEKLLFCIIHWCYLLTNHFGYIYESLFGLGKNKKT